MREIWKQIKGFEGLYSVSNYGNVRRDKTHNKTGTGNYAREEHIKSQKINNKGYFLVDLYKDNKRHQFLVHRLVAIAFLDNPNNYNVVNHTKTKNFCRFTKTTGQLFVCIAWGGISTGMIVHKHYCCCIGKNTGFKYFSWMSHRFIQTSNTCKMTVNRCSVCFHVDYT